MDMFVFWGIPVALFVIVMNLIPVISSYVLLRDLNIHIRDSEARKCADFIIIGFASCVHMGCYLLVHKLYWNHWNFLHTIYCAATMDFTYQEIAFFSCTLAVNMIVALIMAFIFRSMFFVLGKISVKRSCLPRKSIAVLYALFSIVGIVEIGTLYYSFSGVQNLVINEVGSNNINIELDKQGTVCDYVELYNRGNLDCDVHQLYLSDSSEDLLRMEIPSIKVPSHGYAVVKLNDKSMRVKREGGETIFLSTAWGTVLDQVTTVAVEPNFSYCRQSDASDVWEILSSTPGKTNSNGELNKIVRLDSTPMLSHVSGFYEKEFYLQISAEEGVTVHYTLDGSIPTAESKQYIEPILVYNRSKEPNVWRTQKRVVPEWKDYTPDTTPVDKAFIVRAVGIDKNGAVSKPVTAVYFVDMPAYSEENVVSLVVDPMDFWGENGIYVTGMAYDEWYTGVNTDTKPSENFHKRGRAWERPAHFMYFSQNTSFEQEIGIRISGASSRESILKRFSLYARDVYSGTEYFNTNIFENVQSKKLVIRPGYANAVCQMLVPDRSIGIQQAQQVHVFLNGEFWYNASIMEKYDDQYFFVHYGVNPNNIVVMKNGELEEGDTGDELLINEIYDYLNSHDLEDSKGYAEFGEIVDIQSYIDYMCFNIYVDNLDFTETKNSVWWRSREITTKPYEDGKWRFLPYDLDAMEWDDAAIWGLQKQYEKNSFSLMPRYTDGQAINKLQIYMALKENPEFVKRFVHTFMDMVNVNFRYDNVKKVLDAYGRTPERNSIAYYEDFFAARADYIVSYMAEEFSLSGALETLTLEVNDTNGGSIYVNTTKPNLSDGIWSGQYYSDFPITVTAVAEDGYVFKGWRGSVNSGEATLEINLEEGGTSLYAVFENDAP